VHGARVDEPRHPCRPGEVAIGSVYKRGRTWWLKYKDATGTWKPEATKAATKTEAKALLHEIERRVERQRRGLEPLSLNPDGWTVADLMRWWLETYSRHSPSHERNLGTVRRESLGSTLADKLLQHVQAGDLEQLLQAMEGELAASTINHVRQFLVGTSTARARRASGSARTRPCRSGRAAGPSRSVTS
jgi:integrase